MKKLLSLSMIAMVGMTMMMSSCGKYEDGPGLSLRTKKARLTGTWDPVEYVDGATGATTTDTGTETFTIENDGTYSWTSGTTAYSGTWAFASKKEQLQTTFTYSIFGASQTITNTAIITRLTNKELWLKDPSSSDVTKCEKK